MSDYISQQLDVAAVPASRVISPFASWGQSAWSATGPRGIGSVDPVLQASGASRGTHLVPNGTTPQIIGLRRLVPTTIRKSPLSRGDSDWRSPPLVAGGKSHSACVRRAAPHRSKRQRDTLPTASCAIAPAVVRTNWGGARDAVVAVAIGRSRFIPPAGRCAGRSSGASVAESITVIVPRRTRSSTSVAVKPC